MVPAPSWTICVRMNRWGVGWIRHMHVPRHSSVTKLHDVGRKVVPVFLKGLFLRCLTVGQIGQWLRSVTRSSTT